MFPTILLSIATVTFGDWNPIVIENAKHGTPSNEWDINGAGDRSIQGYAVPFSINSGESVDFRINTTSVHWRIDIYRVGYYKGDGARKIATFTQYKASLQPQCIQHTQWRMVSCKNWFSTFTFLTANKSLISGVYFARLTRLDVTNAYHPHYNWRVDNSYVEGLDQFCDENCNTKPNPSAHSYGASGFGSFKYRLKEPYASHVYFIIRNDESESDLIMQTSDTTWHAYNIYGGTSTYGTFDPAHPKKRAFKMSYNRPMMTRDYRSINMLFSAEYPAIRFLERNGFDVTYISGLDLSTFADEDAMMQTLIKHNVFLSVGHDEYWSGKQRKLVTDAIHKHGLHAMFWSGNEMYWKVRFEADAHDDIFAHSDNDTFNGNPRMVIFKETRIRSTKLDKSSSLWTGTWRDEHAAFAFSEQGAYPENAVTGQLYTVDVWRADPIHIAWYFAQHRFWRHCKSINALNIGDTLILKKPLLGHEIDEDIDNGFRPKGLQHLSETTIHNVQYLLDWGTIYDTGTAQHHLTVYKHPKSNALVFGAGSVMFSWALDDFHDSATGIPSHLENYYSCRVVQDGYGAVQELQQAMFNLFADMKVNKPQTMNDDIFVYDEGMQEASGKPVSWISEEDDDVRSRMEDGLKCIRIEGGSIIAEEDDVHVGIIAGIEILVTNETNNDEADKRWYAATIDYKQIALSNDVNNIKHWFWYFEAWIDASTDNVWFAKTRAVNDNGDIEDTANSEYSKINIKKLKTCVNVREWIWRKRPHLSGVKENMQKTEL